MKKLTCSVYTFEDLIGDDFLYVDKTAYLWQLIAHGKGMYFLARPRRFGKSLTVSTLQAIFEGKKELFKDFAIYDKPYDWKAYPVIHLDFGDIRGNTPAELENSLQELLSEVAKHFQVELKTDNAQSQFRELILSLSERGRVVILIDEYDKPVLGNVANAQALGILKVLKDFFSVIKGTEPYQRFVFLTGVSKFSHVSVFSDLNHLQDLTMNPAFATMLGYTQEEFEKYFADRIDAVAGELKLSKAELLKKIKAHYNGYRFEENAATVYNPVSLALFFLEGGKFNNYWFKTGTPTALLELMKKSNFNYSAALQTPVSEAFFDSFEISNLKPKTLLYQTGYLTIDKCVQKTVPYTDTTVREYYLHFPNFEVERSFNEQLLEYYTNVQTDMVQSFLNKLISAVGSGDADGFLKQLQVMFADIPYTIHVANEHYYQTIFFVICDMLKFMVQAEICTNDGRVDMMVGAGDWIYVIEFKLNQSAEKALTQIQNKDYARKFRKEGKRIMLLGVNFDSQAGQITDWLKEEL